MFDTELKAAQDYDIFLRMVVEYGEPWKVEEATQILHINHGEMQITLVTEKNSPGTSTFTASTKINLTVQAKKYQLFTLYQIRNKRMTWRTLLTLLSVRNGKRLADGIRGALKMLEDLRANSWSLRPCCMVLAYRVAHFLFGVAQKRTSSTIFGRPRCWCCIALSPNAFSVMKSRLPRPLAAALLSITVTP